IPPVFPRFRGKELFIWRFGGEKQTSDAGDSLVIPIQTWRFAPDGLAGTPEHIAAQRFWETEEIRFLKTMLGY
ncbi:MAG: hypothetical protein LBR76_08280, partial [Oscillospiraceae bacterium]|nr:hypothetical protein [Oscillospiraceae bacterium]